MTPVDFIISLISTLIDIYLIHQLIPMDDEKDYKHFHYIYLLELVPIFISNILPLQYFFIKTLLFSITILILLKYKGFTKSKQLYIIICIAFLKVPFEQFIYFIFEYMLDIKMNYGILYLYFPTRLITELVIKQIDYCILIFYNFKINNEKKRTHYFKLCFIIISFCFGIILILTTHKLFKYPNIAKTFIFIVVIYNIALIIFDRYQVKHEQKERELTLINQSLISQKEFIKKKKDDDQKIKEMRHDLKNNYIILEAYLNNGQYDEAVKFMRKNKEVLDSAVSSIHSGNVCIDSMIEDKIKMMKQQDILYSESIGGMYLGHIDETDLSILIGYALDNAIEAAAKVNGERKIHFSIQNNKGYLIIRITNSIVKGIIPNFDKTSKLIDISFHGLDVKGMKKIAENYQGEIKYDIKDDSVEMIALLKA